jgi:7-keto-8-aminopelargonate synthetase-like enzyme
VLAVIGGTLKALDLIECSPQRGRRTLDNARYFKQRMREAGFQLVPAVAAFATVGCELGVLAPGRPPSAG